MRDLYSVLALPVHCLALLRGFLEKPLEVASVVPSSPFLIRRVLAAGAAHRARVVVELGAGTGVVTEQILRSMSPDSRLVVVELNAGFAELLRRRYRDPRLSIYHGSSTEVEKALAAAGHPRADLVISGIPFSTMEPDACRQTLEAVRRILAPGGRFVAYQFRDHVRRFAEPIFGAGEAQVELWNVPPTWVFAWELGEYG